MGNKSAGNNFFESNGDNARNANNNYYENYNDNRQKRVVVNKPQVSQTKYKEPKTYRPSLRDREGDIVTGVGYIISQYDESKFTVINLIDNEGLYMADHTQLNMKEKEFNYKVDLNKTRLVEFTGKVEEYTRANNSIDYCINLHHKPLLYDGSWYNSEVDLSFIEGGFNEEKINKFIGKASTREFQDLIIKISNDLNILTKFEYNNNFIFDFITNTFFLNRATYDLYEGNIRSISCSNYALVDLLYIISAVLFEFKVSNVIKLEWLLPKIIYYCNIFQKVYSYNAGCDARFKKYCKQHLNIESNKELNKAWGVLLKRQMNFGSNPNPNNFNQEDIIDTAFYIINQYI